MTLQAKFNLGLKLHKTGRIQEAERIYSEVVRRQPDHFNALHLLGVIALQTGRPEQAVELIKQAITLNAKVAGFHSNLGNALADLKRHESALVSYDTAIALQPDYAEVYINRGAALKNLKRLEDALVSFDKAIALKPELAEAYNNRGIALANLKRHEDALASYNKAIALKPDYAEAYNNRALALIELNHPEDALADYNNAISLSENLPEAEGFRLSTKMHLCDWRNFDSDCEHLITSVRNGRVSTTPFVFLATPSSSFDQLQCAKLWVAHKYPPAEELRGQGKRSCRDRIRLAYVSADFRSHPTAHLTAGLFEQHDRSRFEVIGVSFGDDDRSKIRGRIAAAFDGFYDVRESSDLKIARLLRDLEVDVAIDLMGHTREARSAIFSHRPVPIQVNYLGYPGTMGAPFIDYIIADKIVAPFAEQPFISEKIVHLPNCYQVNDFKRKIAETTPSRRDLALPEHGFVFCCFNNIWKITPVIFDVWMQLLLDVEGSVLWLLSGSERAEQNLREEAQRRGINSTRLVFAKRVPLEEHLSRYRLADLFLDTLPYNAHTTASDALWAGLPVLTCKGETFAGRVAASLLCCIGLSELITCSFEEYRALGLKLALDSVFLAEIKGKLIARRDSFPLFDTVRFTRHIEAAYKTMCDLELRGEAPKGFSVEADQ